MLECFVTLTRFANRPSLMMLPSAFPTLLQKTDK